MKTQRYYDSISGWAGMTVVLLLFLGLAIQYPGPMRAVGIVLASVLVITELINRKWG